MADLAQLADRAPDLIRQESPTACCASALVALSGRWDRSAESPAETRALMPPPPVPARPIGRRQPKGVAAVDTGKSKVLHRLIARRPSNVAAGKSQLPQAQQHPQGVAAKHAVWRKQLAEEMVGASGACAARTLELHRGHQRAGALQPRSLGDCPDAAAISQTLLAPCLSLNALQTALHLMRLSAHEVDMLDPVLKCRITQFQAHAHSIGLLEKLTGLAATGSLSHSE